MRLNNEKKIMLCQKSLYVKQLEYYAKLCEIYSELAKTQGPNVSHSSLHSRYNDALSDAAIGELGFLSENVYGSDYSMPRFSKRERELFREYSFASGRLRQFKEASARLSEAISYEEDGSMSIDHDAVNSYHRYMERKSKSTQFFDKHISEHTPTYLGHDYFVKSRDAVRKIQAIDNTHIEDFTVSKTLTPAAFGANIHGCRTRVDVVNEAKSLDTRQEVAEYKQEPGVIKEVAYVAAVRTGKAIQRFHTNHRNQVRAVILAVLIAGGAVAGAQHLSNAHEYNTLSVDTAAEQGYQLNISPETYARIMAVEASIEAAKNSPTTPTYEELSAIRENLDNVIDDVMTDLVSEAFEEEHPEYTVTGVDTRYDKTVNQGKSPNSEPAKENTVIITYLDEKGEEQKLYVQDFSSTSLMNNGIVQSFNDEYKLDRSHPSASVNENQNFVKNNQDVYASLDSFSEILGNIKHLAATDFEFSDGWLLVDPSIKSVTPEKVTPEENPTNPTNSDRDDYDDR